MTPEDYRDLLARAGLSQVGAGKVFDVHPRTAQRWASGEQDIPRAVAIALTLMVRFNLDPLTLKTRKRVEKP